MTRIEVRAVVDIPAFVAAGLRSGDGRVRVELADVCAYLTTVAATFDSAGANSDIGLSLRTIRNGLAAADKNITPHGGRPRVFQYDAIWECVNCSALNSARDVFCGWCESTRSGGTS